MPINQNPRQLIRPFALSILVAVIFYGLVVAGTDLNAVLDAAFKMSALGWAGILGLSLANYGLRFVRWQIYLARLGYQVPAAPSLAYYLGGFAFTTTPGKAGEAVRSLYLIRHGVTYVHSIGALFAERLVDLLAMLLLAVGAVIVFPDSRIYAVVLTGAAGLLMFAIHSLPFRRFLERRHARIPFAGARTLAERILSLLAAASALLRAGPLYAGLGLGFLAWGAEGVALHLILNELDVFLPVLLVVGIYAISMLTGAISFIPGGLGSTEAAMTLLLVLSGVDMVVAVAATLICRLATLWFAVIIGIIILAVLESRVWSGSGEKPSETFGVSQAERR